MARMIRRGNWRLALSTALAGAALVPVLVLAPARAETEAGGDREAGAAVAAREPILAGVMNAPSFTWSKRRGAVAGILAHGSPLPAVGLADQLEALDLRAVHLTVVADDGPGRFAKGAMRDVAALRQPGLKVLDPEHPDPTASCFTVMTCLIDLDQWSRAHPAHGPLVVIMDLQPVTDRPGRLARVMRLARGSKAQSAPRWDQLADEIATVLTRDRIAASLADAHGKLLIVARGGEGTPPPGAPFLIAGRDREARLFDARGAYPGQIETAKAQGALVVVIGADWEDRRDELWEIGALEAARLGADIVVFKPEAARRRPQR